MKRREFIALIGGASVAWPLLARAQQPDRTRLVGVLMGDTESDLSRRYLAVFRRTLARLGWMEGSNLQIAVRWGGSDPAVFAHQATELVASGPDVLLAHTTPSLEAIRQQTRTIPIVFLTVADPIGQGFVASLAHPGGNITGFTVFDSPMAAKWLGMLRQINPPVASVAVLFNPATTPYIGLMLKAINEAAPSLPVTVQAAPVDSDSEVEAMMGRLAREEHGGVLVPPSVFTSAHRNVIIALAARHRLPAVYAFPYFAAEGGLMSYGVDITDLFRRSADYVDRVLKGANPGDLPVQLPIKFNLVINLKTAKALDITIASSLLATADEVIE